MAKRNGSSYAKKRGKTVRPRKARGTGKKHQRKIKMKRK